MSFGTRILQPVLECGTYGGAKARFLFLEQPTVLSCQEVSATLSILFGRHSSSCKVTEERPSLCWRSVINHFQTCKARYLCSAISYGVTWTVESPTSRMFSTYSMMWSLSHPETYHSLSSSLPQRCP